MVTTLNKDRHLVEAFLRLPTENIVAVNGEVFAKRMYHLFRRRNREEEKKLGKTAIKIHKKLPENYSTFQAIYRDSDAAHPGSDFHKSTRYFPIEFPPLTLKRKASTEDKDNEHNVAKRLVSYTFVEDDDDFTKVKPKKHATRFNNTPTIHNYSPDDPPSAQAVLEQCANLPPPRADDLDSVLDFLNQPVPELTSPPPLSPETQQLVNDFLQNCTPIAGGIPYEYTTDSIQDANMDFIPDAQDFQHVTEENILAGYEGTPTAAESPSHSEYSPLRSPASRPGTPVVMIDLEEISDDELLFAPNFFD
jgi:hypothetical protein